MSKDPAQSGASSPRLTPANALGQSPAASYFGNLGGMDSFSLDSPGSDSAASSQQHTNKQLNAAVDALGAQRGREGARPQLAPASTPPLPNFVGTPDYLAPESILGVGTDACVDWVRALPLGSPWHCAPLTLLRIHSTVGSRCHLLRVSGSCSRFESLLLTCCAYIRFLYGIPPFHDETPEKVFENILSRRLDWHEDIIELAPEAHDFIDRLLCTDPKQRLGAKGAAEVKAHPFMAGIDWDNLLNGEVDFVPKVSDPENTDYFDARGATDQVFADDDVPTEELSLAAAPTPSHPHTSDPFNRSMSKLVSPSSSTSGSRRSRRERSETGPSPQDDFGTFTFRNLTVLKQANDDVIRKMRDEQLLPPASMPMDSPLMHPRQNALAGKGHKSRNASIDLRASRQAHRDITVSGLTSFSPQTPSSPSSHSNSSSSSSVPTKQTAPSSTYSPGSSHSRRTSEVPQPLERFRSRQPSTSADTSGSRHSRRNSMPSRLRTNSMSEGERPVISDSWARHERRRTSTNMQGSSTLPSPVEGQESLPPLSIPMTQTPKSHSPETYQASSAPTGPSQTFSSMPASAIAARMSTIDCLVAGRNPIVVKVLETMLVRLGCRCITVPDGGEAILAAQGVHFDVLFVDLVSGPDLSLLLFRLT